MGVAAGAFTMVGVSNFLSFFRAIRFAKAIERCERDGTSTPCTITAKHEGAEAGFYVDLKFEVTDANGIAAEVEAPNRLVDQPFYNDLASFPCARSVKYLQDDVEAFVVEGNTSLKPAVCVDKAGSIVLGIGFLCAGLGILVMVCRTQAHHMVEVKAFAVTVLLGCFLMMICLFFKCFNRTKVTQLAKPTTTNPYQNLQNE